MQREDGVVAIDNIVAFPGICNNQAFLSALTSSTRALDCFGTPVVKLVLEHECMHRIEARKWRLAATHATRGSMREAPHLAPCLFSLSRGGTRPLCA
jgi:hypothetical protein